MDTKLLEIFMLAADAGSLSGAASVLGVPQSAVSRRIKELEAHCNTRLLYRNGRGVTLTDAGRTLYGGARPLLDQFTAVIDNVSGAAGSPSGVVGIAMSPSIMAAIGLPLMAEMDRLHPKIRLHTVTGYTGYVLEWLLQGRVDIGILSDARHSPMLRAEELGSIDMVMVASPNLKLPKKPGAGGTIRYADLAGLPLIMPTLSHGSRKYMDLAAAKTGVRLDVLYELDDLALTLDLVHAGRAATLLSPLAVAREVAAGELVQYRVVAPQILARSLLATALNRPVTHAMKAVSAVLTTLIGRALATH